MSHPGDTTLQNFVFFLGNAFLVSCVRSIQDVPRAKVNILLGYDIGHSKKKTVYMYMCPIPNGFRDRTLSLYRGATRHILTRVAKCIDVDGGIFENVL
jgi:hypothetical protein